LQLVSQFVENILGLSWDGDQSERETQRRKQEGKWFHRTLKNVTPAKLMARILSTLGPPRPT
jgi:hypothetical protein